MIFMYFTNSKPLGGNLKQRYWDFLVNEMYSENGEQKTAQILSFDTLQEEYFKIPENTNNTNFLYCDMQKQNTDLQNVIKSLCLVMQCGKSRIGTAGLKDKRAVTCQRISIYQPNVELLKKFGSKMVKLHDFRWREAKVDIGDLIGNSFTIIIRDIDKEEKEIKEIIESFSKDLANGTPNKFGEQRFGGIRDVTHEVGRLFIEGKTKEAVLHYLTKTVDRESQEVKDARALVAEGKYKESLKKFPKLGYRYERAIIDKLAKTENDFTNAWSQLPKNISYLFTHAYQSYIFNKYLDLRIKTYGKESLKPQDGDILDESGNVLGQLFGYDSEFSKGKVGELEKQVLKDENVTLDMFNVKHFPQMSVSGTKRPISLQVYDFKLLEIIDDEFNPGKKCAKVSFWLDKSNYATTVLEELMKNA